jgi:hypothetical protein
MCGSEGAFSARALSGGEPRGTTRHVRSDVTYAFDHLEPRLACAAAGR